MSKFCEKCGNQLNDDDVFCEKCGTRAESGGMTNSTDTAQSVSGSTSQQATVQPEVVILQKEKMNPLKIIIPIVSGVLVVTLIIALVMMFGKGVVKTSKDGKKVFAFNPKEFVERYNKTNADVLTSEFDFSSFSVFVLLYRYFHTHFVAEAERYLSHLVFLCLLSVLLLAEQLFQALPLAVSFQHFDLCCYH